MRFALPLALQCTDCSLTMEVGLSLAAQKRMLGIGSESCIPTWKFDLQCPTCGAEFSLCTTPLADEYFVGGAVSRTFSTTLKQRRRSDSSGCADTESENFKSGILSLDDDDTRRKRELSELERIRRNRQWQYGDTAATAKLLTAWHKRRWNNTPLRIMARAAVAAPKAERKTSRRANRAVRSQKTLPLADQRSRTGGLRVKEFLRTREAVRRLHRGGALKNVLSSSSIFRDST